jgi:hypothetical protein
LTAEAMDDDGKTKRIEGHGVRPVRVSDGNTFYGLTKTVAEMMILFVQAHSPRYQYIQINHDFPPRPRDPTASEKTSPWQGAGAFSPRV